MPRSVAVCEVDGNEERVTAARAGRDTAANRGRKPAAHGARRDRAAATGPGAERVSAVRRLGRPATTASVGPIRARALKCCAASCVVARIRTARRQRVSRGRRQPHPRYSTMPQPGEPTHRATGCGDSRLYVRSAARHRRARWVSKSSTRCAASSARGTRAVPRSKAVFDPRPANPAAVPRSRAAPSSAHAYHGRCPIPGAGFLSVDSPIAEQIHRWPEGTVGRGVRIRAGITRLFGRVVAGEVLNAGAHRGVVALRAPELVITARAGHRWWNSNACWRRKARCWPSSHRITRCCPRSAARSRPGCRARADLLQARRAISCSVSVVSMGEAGGSPLEGA